MKKVKITVNRIACYKDLIDEYENPILHTCSMKLNDTFIANGWEKLDGFCNSAWDTYYISSCDGFITWRYKFI